MRVPPIQSSYIAALSKLHEQQLERLRIDPEIEKQYDEIRQLRERLRLALSRKKLRPPLSAHE
ncbi:hypothetical protein ACVWZ6_005867 [Bradyrhizobium sp. GM6.1]|jgi:hypothetical protein